MTRISQPISRLFQPLQRQFQRLNHLGFSDHPLAHEMQWERHHLFMKEVGPRMAATLVAAVVVGLLFIQSASNTRLAIWFGMNLFVGLNSWLILRHYHLQHQHKQHQQSDAEDQNFSQPLPEQQRTIQKWHLANIYLSLLWGFQWAALPLLFLADASLVQIFSLLLLVTITSTMPSMSMGLYPDVYVTFLTPVLGAFGWHLMSMDLGGAWLHKLMAPAVWLSLVGFSFAMFKTQIQALATRLELQHSKREVEQANHAKTRFLAAASHDLRQPLQAASMYWSAMDTPTDDNQARMFKRMGSSLNAASDMLSALLDLSRMDSGSVKPVMTAVSLNALTNELNTVFRPLATQKKLQLNWIIPDNCQILCDRQMMMQILKNLIANAIQYTEKGSVEIQAWQQGNSLTINVRDTGLGIPADQQADIFEEFVQLHNSARQREKGLGLGLSIVSRLCQLQQIPLKLESHPGAGSQFQLECLIASDADFPAPVKRAARQDLSGLKVLIIDDHEDVLDALSSQLVSLDCDVWVANSPHELEKQLQQPACRPDIVLTDDLLQDGVRANDVMDRVLAHSDIQARFIVITGNTDSERLRKLNSLGVPVLHKPIETDQLIQCLSEQMEALSDSH